MHIVLPPFSEQQRIVAKVNELMAVCDRLESSLAGADITRNKLLESVLHEALTAPDRVRETSHTRSPRPRRDARDWAASSQARGQG